jgi:hypothetical protein
LGGSGGVGGNGATQATERITSCECGLPATAGDSGMAFPIAAPEGYWSAQTECKHRWLMWVLS